MQHWFRQSYIEREYLNYFLITLSARRRSNTQYALHKPETLLESKTYTARESSPCSPNSDSSLTQLNRDISYNAPVATFRSRHPERKGHPTDSTAHELHSCSVRRQNIKN